MRDDDGGLRAMLGLDEDAPMLMLWDENGNVRAWLSVDKDGPALRVFDEKGKTIWSAPQ